MNHEIDNETLIAFVDDELDGATAASVKAAMLRDPTLRQHADRIRSSRHALRGALDQLAEEPVPERIRALCVAPEREHQPQGRLAIAASVALVVGALAGYWFGTGPGGDQPIAAWQGAHQVAVTDLLDTTTTGVVVHGQGVLAGIELQPVLSFKDRAQRVCRQYVVCKTDTGAAVDGVACRTDQGAWQVELARPRALAKPSGTPEYKPALGTSNEFDAFVDALIDRPLTDAEERELLSGAGR